MAGIASSAVWNRPRSSTAMVTGTSAVIVAFRGGIEQCELAEEVPGLDLPHVVPLTADRRRTHHQHVEVVPGITFTHDAVPASSARGDAR